MNWPYTFDFTNASEPDVRGSLHLMPPKLVDATKSSTDAFREGKLLLGNGRELDLMLYHNLHTSAFFYLSDVVVTPQLHNLLGLSDEFLGIDHLQLPGQFILGGHRTRLVHQAVAAMMQASPWIEMLQHARQDTLAVFPILREGAKYGIVEALCDDYNYVADEILVDAHHVDAPDVPGYGRRTRIAVFKDNDLNQHQRNAMKTAIVGDSIASGTVLISVVEALCKRYVNLENIEIVAPFAALRGLARLAAYALPDVRIRVHAFESVLHALPPDYYWSAHFAEPAFHFDAAREAAYRAWWGQDEAGNWIADTACAGYGWSEAFFNPPHHLRMVNEQLQSRHNLGPADVMTRNLSLAL